MKPINWKWFAGFFQAEGSPTGYREEHRPVLSIGQKSANDSVLEDIRHFIASKCRYTPALNPDGDGITRLKINKIDAATLVSNNLLPYLRCRKRQQVLDWAEEFALLVFDVPQEPLDWETLTGFWEGDGGTSLNIVGRKRGYANTNFCIDFKQDSDPKLLSEIRTFLGKGAHSGKGHLRICDSKKEDLFIHHKLLEYARMTYRRQQLIKQLLLFERERDNLNDARTITRYRELIAT